MKALLIPGLVLTIGCATPAPPAGNTLASPPPRIGGPCDGCELLFEGMPPENGLTSEATLATASEAGEPMVIEGRLTGADGRTPAADVVLYAYHTDAAGLYAPSAEQRFGKRHGRLRGWVRTGPDGRFTLRTIRPASYPNERIPAHIHVFVKESGKDVYYVDEVRFLDDPLLTAEERAHKDGRGGDLDIALTKDSTGTWRGDLVIALGRNIPDYR